MKQSGHLVPSQRRAHRQRFKRIKSTVLTHPPPAAHSETDASDECRFEGTIHPHALASAASSPKVSRCRRNIVVR